jgi:prefoldin subunit 5
MEHTDLKLDDITMRLDELRGQLESVQQVLKEVE